MVKSLAKRGISSCLRRLNSRCIEQPDLQTRLPFLFVHVCMSMCVNDFPLEICLLNKYELQCNSLKAFKNKNNMLYFSAYEFPDIIVLCLTVIVCHHRYFAAGGGT
jgi:hypothetical protein